ncbi:hypothetical protein LZC95_21620 [Pendulispora brunnea]|uniref:Tetratricopeptide repeat protein n=1 Tax=Pendulispora brunnea TaxID=2905690 RepID=A0ABZ2KL70_9BACT
MPLSFAQGAPTAVSAAGVDDELAEAEKLVANVDFEAAIPVLERISKRNGLTHEQLIRTYRNLATAHAVVGHANVARDIFVKLIAIDPDFKIDQNMSPRVKAPYFEARGSWSAQSIKPGIEATAQVHRSSDTRVTVTLRDPMRMASKVVVGYHWEGSDPFTVKTSGATATTTLVVPPPKDKSTYLEIYAQGLDANDSVLFESGSPAKPIVIEAPASAPAGALAGSDGGQNDHSSSIFASPIFWIVAGAVVAGGAAAAYFALRPSDPAKGQQLVPTAYCGGAPCP